MAKKPTQKKTPTPEYDPKRQENVLLEQISKDVKTIAEGHSVLDHKLDTVNNKLEEHDKRFNMLETAVKEVDSKVKTIDARLERVEKGQEEIQQKLDTVTEDHEHRIQKLEAAR